MYECVREFGIVFCVCLCVCTDFMCEETMPGLPCRQAIFPPLLSIVNLRQTAPRVTGIRCFRCRLERPSLCLKSIPSLLKTLRQHPHRVTTLMMPHRCGHIQIRFQPLNRLIHPPVEEQFSRVIKRISRAIRVLFDREFQQI